jgi:hypothetical protein
MVRTSRKLLALLAKNKWELKVSEKYEARY